MSGVRHRLQASPGRILTAASLGLLLLAAVSRATTSEALTRPVLKAIGDAEAALRQREPQLAESRFRTALQKGWLLVGALDVAETDLEAAKSAYEAALASAVETRQAQISLAAIEIKLGQPTEAIKPLRLMVSMDTMDHQARELLAQALAANGQMAESIQEMEELRVLFPDDLENYYQLGTAYLRQKKVEQAEQVLNELADKRSIPQTYVLIGRTYRDFDDYARARAALNQALAMDPEVRRANYYLGSVAIFENGQAGLDEAMGYLRRELELDPTDPMSNLYLGMSLVEARREEEAISFLEIAARNPVSQVQALEFLGRAYLRVDRVDEAIATLEQVLELAESAPDQTNDQQWIDRRLRQISQVHYQLGLAYRREGDSEAAARHFTAAETYKARQAEDTRERLDVFMRTEPADQSRQSLTSPLETPELEGLTPADRRQLRARLERTLAQIYLNLGVLQVQAKHIDQAGDLFAEAVRLEPDSPQMQYSLGVARFNSGQYELATTPLARALESDPDNAELKRMLALSWFNSEEYENAVALLQDDPERQTNRLLQYAYGVALVRSGRGAEAQAIFSDLLAKFPDWGELNVVLGQALAQQDDYPRAIELLQTAIAEQPDVAEAHLSLGEIYMRRGELEAAERELRAELESHPEDLRAQHLLAMVLDLSDKPDEAIEVLRMLLEENPTYAKARYLLGKILLAQGHLEQAEIQLESATQLAPEEPEAYYQLGLALQRQGRNDEARASFETYQTLKREERSGGGA